MIYFAFWRWFRRTEVLLIDVLLDSTPVTFQFFRDFAQAVNSLIVIKFSDSMHSIHCEQFPFLLVMLVATTHKDNSLEVSPQWILCSASSCLG